MKKKFLLVCISLVLSSVLSFKLYNILHVKKPVIIRLEKEDFIFPKNSPLKYFYEHKSGINLKDESGKEIVNTINSDSLNERFDYSIDKSQDTFRIVNLGDSWAYGYGIPTKDNYSEVLEDELNKNLACKNIKKVEVINLGVQGYDIEFASERYRLRGKKYNPDLILWITKPDDFIPQELVLEKASRLALADKNLTLKKVDSAEYYLAVKKYFLKAQEELFSEMSSEKMVEYEMKSLVSITGYYKNRFLFFSYGMLSDERAVLDNFIKSKSPSSYIFESKLLSEGQRIPNDGHPNQKGHEMLAQEIYQYIVNNNIIPCN